ncbi:MAG: UDP-N-acetylmuramate:L-alanyl-gamma-D-glutamyl-meso-diaminopimelate ligase [Acidobacteriaceae bacterium]
MKSVYLIGICGTAMASLAGLLKAKGMEVRGSDAAAYPPMSTRLIQMGIAVAPSYDARNLDPRPDLVVVGNAISRGNMELERVLDEHIPLASMADVLHREFLAHKSALVVAGTHGKTTTTSMLAWIFETAGRPPSFLIGGVAENFRTDSGGGSYAWNEGSCEFIIEGDEYDTSFFDKGPKFLHYFPDAAILTSVEFDHADIYRDLDAVKTAFKRLVNLVPRRGRIIARDADENVTECLAKAFCAVERYGFQEESHWRVRNVEYRPEKTLWSLERGGRPWGDFEMSLAGEYNVLNAAAAAALASRQGIELATIQQALATFKSVKRRLEVRAVVDGITIIDDFAHHPTAIAETLKALRTRYPNARLWAVLEPRSNTLRRNVFENELVDALAHADQIVIASVFKSEAIPELQRLSLETVLAMLKSKGKPALQLADADAIVAEIAGQLRTGDVVAILSNGGFDGIYEKLPAAVREAFSIQQSSVSTQPVSGTQ